MNIYQLIKNFKNELLVLFGYLLFTIFLTYPVFFRIGSTIPGGSDAFQWMRSLWYTKYAILNPEITSLFHDNLLFYPYGVPISPFPSAFNQLLYFFLSPFFDLSSCYSLQWLLTFILGAFGTYLLVKYLVNNSYAAFISGIIFVFNPFHLIHGLGHFGATTIQWIPFCALFLMKIFKEGGQKNCLLGGFFFFLVAMSDLQYLLFMVIFILLFIIYDFYISVYQRKNGNFFDLIRKYFLFFIVAIPGALIITINDITIALSNQNYLKPNPYEAVTYSTDLISFFIPSSLHPLFREYVSPIYQSFLGNPSECTTYIGYTILLLSIIAIISYRKDIIARFWFITAFFFSILSLGPILHIFGRINFTIFNTTIPLPHLILYYALPFMENCRTVGRFFVIASLAYAVLAGYGIKKILDYQKVKNYIVFVVIIFFIVFEYLCIPFPTSTVEQPEIFMNLSNDTNQYGILNLPSAIKNYQAQVETSYYQTIHHKALVGNHHARIPYSARDFEKNTPFIRELFYLKNFDNDILNQNVTDIGNSILNKYNIKYIIINEKYMIKEDILFATNFINASLKIDPIYYNKDNLIVYSVPNELLLPFNELGNGWYSLEKWHDEPGRWINKEANLNVFSPKNQTINFSFEVGSLDIERDLSILLNGKLTNTYKIPKIMHNDVTPLTITQNLNLTIGENHIDLFVIQSGSIPSEIHALDDNRELTLAFQNISFEKGINPHSIIR